MRTAARKDRNHNEIAATFASLGWSVLDIYQLPKSADILIGKWGYNIVIEIKDGQKPPSKRQLTSDEEEFRNRWNGDYRIIKKRQEAIDLDQEYKEKACNVVRACYIKDS